MNAVHVMCDGFRLFRFPWYMYGYIGVDLAKHVVKGVMPKKIYMFFHKKSMERIKP